MAPLTISATLPLPSNRDLRAQQRRGQARTQAAERRGQHTHTQTARGGSVMATTWSYIGRTTTPLDRWPNVGSVICAAVDEPARAADTAKLVAKWIKDGLTIERVPVEWVRKHFGSTTAYVPEPEAA